MKYVGNVDGEDPNDVYVGVKLDAPNGDHGGIVRGKRYFKCGEAYGIMVPLQDVVDAPAQVGLCHTDL